MSLRSYFLLLSLILSFLALEDKKHRSSAPKTNAVHNFHKESLSAFVKDYKFVVVLYNQPKTKKGKRVAKWYFETAKTHDVNEVFFLQIETKPKNKSKVLKPKINMYVYGFKKTYHGDMNHESLHHWIADIVRARPTEIKSLDQIDEVDSHYFAVINENWFKANKSHLTVLAKLISPLNILYELSKEEINKLTDNKSSTSPLWVFREYNREIIEVDINLPLKKKADFILNHEFPAYVVPNPESYRLITEFKAPVLIYFTNDKDDEFIDIIKKIAKPYSDYLITMSVIPEKKNKTARFFMNYMGIDTLPTLRILNIQENVRRYKYMGELEPSLIEYFLQNYKLDNLKPYTLNEPMKKDETVLGFLKANHERFKKLLNDKVDANLIYIYSSYKGRSRDHLENLELIQSVFRENKNFKIYLIDQDKNDLDGFFRTKLPILLLTAPPKQLYHFENEYDFTNLANFIITKLPHMKLAEPEFSDEL